MTDPATKSDLEKQMEINAEKKRRVNDERTKDNKGVLGRYNIKPRNPGSNGSNGGNGAGSSPS